MRRLIFLVVLSLQFISNSTFAKALYMTVRRDFSPKESPQIEINYAKTDPIYLRILSPKDQKAFISSQIDLRRAWREPKSSLNPMHFLLSGQNETDVSTDWIRLGLDSATRQELSPSFGGGYLEEDKAIMPKGSKKIISIPEGFTVVKEVTIIPENEDKNNPFDVPGFMDGDYYVSDLKTKIIDLPPLPPGFYVVQTLQGTLEGQVVLVVNDIMAQLQVSKGDLLYRIAQRNGTPVSGATIEVRNLTGKWIGKVITNTQGEATLKDVIDTDLISLISSSQGVAIIDSEYYSTSASFPDLYLYTDRPMYRESDEIQFRGILRELKNGLSSTKLDSKQVKFSLESLSGEVLSGGTNIKVSEFGTFSGKFTVPAGIEGLVRVVAKLGKADHSGEVRIKNYVKPLFFVDIKSEQENLKAGSNLKAKVKIERYAGGVPNVSQAQVQLYRVRMSAPQWVDDLGLGENGSAVTYGFDSGSEGNASMLPVLVTELSDLTFDGHGEANLDMTIPTTLSGSANYDYQFVLKVTIIDSDDNMASASKKFFDLAADVVAQARFGKIVVTTIAETKLLCKSVTASGKPIPNSKGEIELFLTDPTGNKKSLSKQSINSDAKGTFVLAIPDSLKGAVGELLAQVKFFDKAGRSSMTEASLILAGSQPGAQILDLREPRVLANSFEVTPSQKLQMIMLLPKGWGINGQNKGNLFLTVAGDKIYSTKTISIEGNSVWIDEPVLKEYGTAVYLSLSYPHADRSWVERRSSFRIIEEGKKLKLSIKPINSNLPPGAEQTVAISVKDSSGAPARAEVSISVVDRAVFDLQPEIRPGLLEFFYPLTKIDLMSFYSSQFQGYGYGDEIAKLFRPNFKMAAAKAESKVMDQRDTAFWSGQVVTDEKGEAKVTFTLPGNQTIWRTTVVAVDNQGRFGESTSEFKAQSPVSILLGFPSFLRKGDRSKMRVNITSTQATEVLPVSYKLTPETKEGVIFDSKVEIQDSLKPKAQISKSFMMSVGDGALPGTSQGMIGEFTFGKNKLKFRDNIKIQPGDALTPEFLFPEKNRFQFKLGKTETVQKATVHLTTGLAGVVYPVMEWMVHYPYGCVEQTLSTTLANMVVSQWLERAEKAGVILSEKEKTLKNEAKEFSKNGVSRLASFQGKGGGFNWFIGDTYGADVNMSLLVMSSLIQAQELGQEVELSTFQPTYQFLKDRGFSPTSPQGIVLTYIESLLNARYVVYLSREQVLPNLKVQLNYALTKATLLEKAYLLRALYNFANIDGFKSEKAQLAKSVSSELQGAIGTAGYRSLKWSPNQNGWEAFPGHWISALSFAAGVLKTSDSSSFEKIKTGIKWQILEQFNGQHFGSTYDNAAVFLSSLPLMDEELVALRSKSSIANINLKINGQVVAAKDTSMTPTLGGLRIDLPLEALSKQPLSTVEYDAASTMLARMVVQKRQPLADVPLLQRGWMLERKYYQLQKDGQKIPIEFGKTKLKVGDLVYAEIKFLRQVEKNDWSRSRYYVLTESVAAGLTPVQEDETYRAAPFNLPLKGNYRVREVGNEQVRWYYDFSRGWMDRNEVIGMVFRVNFAGSFESGLTRMDDFYDETLTSLAPSVHFNFDSVDSK